MQPVKILKFVKLKHWYIPFDADSYRTLHRLRIPNVRFHEDFIETLQLLTRKRHLRATCVPFASVQEEFLQQIKAAWERNPKRKCILAQGTIRLESKDLKKVRESFPAVESCLRRFFRRWGFSSEYDFSESPTRAKLNVRFAFDATRQPVIEFIKPF
jgi:hypothetical protein